MDETVKIVIKILGLILSFAGVIFIFDARTLGKNCFSFVDRNEAAKILKIEGFII